MAERKPSAPSRRRRLSLDEYVDGVLRSDRTVLGRAITLVESSVASDQDLAQEMLLKLLPHTGHSQRIGITGVPGVGKSTFIEALGRSLTASGKRVAVLAVDPTSGVTGGSILGDKTRMTELSRDAGAFVRPSPSGGTLGGVTRKTRETMLVCEAAGFDVILVETVGVGQSETTVSEMVDFFLVLMLANAGDELQGIKRGVLELADLIAINKSDQSQSAANLAKREYSGAMRLMRMKHGLWRPPVITVSALKNHGLDVLWAKVQEHRELMQREGILERVRKEQLMRWMWTMVDERVLSAVRLHPEVAAQSAELERQVLDGRLTPTRGAQAILRAFGVAC